jgi:hypothetical protein
MKLRTDLKSGASYYQVKEGDSLAKIAEASYANTQPSDTVRLYSANQTAIGVDPCVLPVGVTLLIPDRPVAPAPQPYYPPIPPTPKPSKNMPGACSEFWGNGKCLYKVCPYPPFQMPC